MLHTFFKSVRSDYPAFLDPFGWVVVRFGLAWEADNASVRRYILLALLKVVRYLCWEEVLQEVSVAHIHLQPEVESHYELLDVLEVAAEGFIDR